MAPAFRLNCDWCKIRPSECPWHENPKLVVGIDFGRDENSIVTYAQGVDEFLRELRSYNWEDYTHTGRKRLTREEEFSEPIKRWARGLRVDGPISSDIVGSNSHLSPYAASDLKAVAAMYINKPEEQEEKMNRRDVIEAQLRNLQRELAILERFPKGDNFEDGTVLKFDRVFGSSWEDLKDFDNVIKYTYAAIKFDGLWYLSGLRQPSGPMKWGKLVEWLGDGVGEIWLMVPDVRIVGDSDEAYPQQADSKLSLSDPAKAVYETTSPEADR